MKNIKKIIRHMKEHDFIYLGILLIASFWLSGFISAYPFLLIFMGVLLYNSYK